MHTRGLEARGALAPEIPRTSKASKERHVATSPFHLPAARARTEIPGWVLVLLTRFEFESVQ